MKPENAGSPDLKQRVGGLDFTDYPHLGEFLSEKVGAENVASAARWGGAAIEAVVQAVEWLLNPASVPQGANENKLTRAFENIMNLDTALREKDGGDGAWARRSADNKVGELVRDLGGLVGTIADGAQAGGPVLVKRYGSNTGYSAASAERTPEAPAAETRTIAGAWDRARAQPAAEPERRASAWDRARAEPAAAEPEKRASAWDRRSPDLSATDGPSPSAPGNNFPKMGF